MNVDRTFEKKIDFTFAGGPSYSKTTSLGIGLLAAGLYRLDRTDSVTAPSDVSLFANISISGVYAVGVTGNTIFSQDRRRLNYTVMFSSTPRDMWGVGYNAGRYNKPVSYTEKHYLVEANYLYRILPKTYIGTVLSFEHTAGKKFSDEKEFSYLTYLHGEKTHYTATGLGVTVEYDRAISYPIPSGAFISVSRSGSFPRDWAIATRRCGGRSSRPMPTSGCGRTVSSPPTFMPCSTAKVRRGRCLPVWATTSGCADTTRAVMPITA